MSASLTASSLMSHFRGMLPAKRSNSNKNKVTGAPRALSKAAVKFGLSTPGSKRHAEVSLPPESPALPGKVSHDLTMAISPATTSCGGSSRSCSWNAESLRSYSSGSRTESLEAQFASYCPHDRSPRGVCYDEDGRLLRDGADVKYFSTTRPKVRRPAPLSVAVPPDYIGDTRGAR
mmetsp:Transcript_21174/g.38661  ORF Transcript_21174/g.38661 Transcript_21174/m.38661 type:complete len:176 (-) Transcript_21174:100-627(-)